MGSMLKRVALLALAVLAVVLLHDRVRRENKEQTTAPQETNRAALSDGALAVPVIRADGEVALGRVEENEDGGVRVTVSAQDGTETTYVFTDVAADSWYVDAVNFAVSAGLMTGVDGADQFRPEYGMLREQFAAILYRFAKGEPVGEASATFEDVSPDGWYYDAVNWVVSKGLMGAAEPGRFGVGEYMTCEQALIGLYRAAGEPETDGALTDYPYAAKVSDAGRSAVDWAWKNGLITEVECVWYPTQAISRAQVALLLTRYSALF